MAKGHAALVTVVFGLAQNVVQCKVKCLVLRYIHKIQRGVFQRFVHQVHSFVIEEKVDRGGEVHLGGVGEHVIHDGTVRYEVHAAEFGAHVNGTAAVRLAVVGVQHDDVARDARIHQLLLGSRLELPRLLVVGDVSEHVDIFCVIELVFSHTESGVNPAGLVAGGDGHHHFALVHVLGAVVDLEHDVVRVHLLQDFHARMLDGVATMEDFHAAEVGEEWVGAVQFGTSVKGELVAEVEIFFQRDFCFAEGFFHEIDGVEIEGLHPFFGVDVVVISVGIESCGTSQVGGAVIELVEFVFTPGENA